MGLTMETSELSRPTEFWRIEWVDVCRGSALLLVLLGHCTPNSEYFGINIRGIIFSFHMPLFFLLSGYTFHFSKNSEMAKNKALYGLRKLVLPAYVCYVVRATALVLVNVLRGGQLAFTRIAERSFLGREKR